MKVRDLFLSSSILLDPSLGKASELLAKQDIFTIWSLQQYSQSIAELPTDIVNLVGRELFELESYGVRFNEEAAGRWVSFVDPVAFMSAFRDGKYSDQAVMAVWTSREQIKTALLAKLSAQWQEGLKELVSKAPKQDGDTWNSGQAYVAGFLAYYLIGLRVPAEAASGAAKYAAATDAAIKNTKDLTAGGAAWQASQNSDLNAATYAAAFGFMGDTYSTANNAAYKAAYYAAYNAAYNAIERAARRAAKVATVQKLIVLGFHPKGFYPDHQHAQISYDLAELFTLVWLSENGHEYRQRAFEAAYEVFPPMELYEVTKVIEAEINEPKFEHNIFIQELQGALRALKKACMSE